MGDWDCINEERVNAMAQEAWGKITGWVGWVQEIPHACGLRFNDQPEGDSAQEIPLVLVVLNS